MFVKLLILKPFLFAKTNGAEISLSENIQLFQEAGHQVEVHCVIPGELEAASKALLSEEGLALEGWPKSYQLGSCVVKLHFIDGLVGPHELESQSSYEEAFQEILRSADPDLVWVHYTDFFAVSAAIQFNPKICWVRQTDNEYPRLKTLEDFVELVPSFRQIQNFLVASEFMKAQMESDFPEARVLHLANPLLNLKQMPPQTNEDYILFVNPVEVKGRDFAIALAKRFPQEKFLFLGNWSNEIPTKLPPNVETCPRQKEMAEVLKRAKLLIVPSQWEEAFGRLPLEAMAAGVPVISSDRGALPKTLGEGGLSIPLDEELWLSKVQEVLSEPEVWSSRGKARVREYLQFAQNSFRSYLQLVQSE